MLSQWLKLSRPLIIICILISIEIVLAPGTDLRGFLRGFDIFARGRGLTEMPRMQRLLFEVEQSPPRLAVYDADNNGC